MIDKDLYPELTKRWEKIRSQMKRENIKACLLTSSANLFYTAGRVFKGYIYIDSENEPLFFVQRPIGLNGDNIHYIKKQEDIKPLLSELLGSLPENVAVEADFLTYNEYKRLEKAFEGIEFKNATSILRGARSIKTDYEIGKLKESGLKHAAVYSHIPGIYEEGMTDDEVSIEVERISRKFGNLGMFRIFGSSMETFAGSVVAGENADNPSPYDFAMGGSGLNPSLPVGANGTILRPGMTLMVDLGGNFTGYMTDMTRVFVVKSLENDLAKRAHNCSIEIEKEIMKLAKPGVPVKELYELAVSIANNAGLKDYFMGYSQKAGFIGHGVGIEINELPVIAPRSRDILEAGMVFALEPKFVIPGVGAVGNENTFVVRENGLEVITVFEEDIIEIGF